MNYISIQTQNLALVNNSRTEVHEGSSVYVRVLSEDSPQNYTVYFAGNRVKVKSPLPLKAGQAFAATIKTSPDGKILLVPSAPSLSSKENSRIQNFLLSQGIQPDAVTERLLAMMQNLGVKINTRIISRAALLASKFPGKEKKAADLALLLEEKGIEATESLVAQLLMEIDSSYSGDSEKKEEEPRDQNKDTADQRITGLYQDPLPEKSGLLAFFNHMQVDGPLQWLILPYEYSLKDKKARGSIRIQYNRELKTTEKVCIDLRFNNDKLNKKVVTNYFFVLYYSISKVREMRFCTLPPLLTSRIPFEEKRLGEFLRSGMNDDSVAAIYSTSAFTEGFFLNDEIPLSFDDSV
ncbi:hypothetical protein [Treponema sp.]|uniref:hypothetical protein n=1 Tax=Treponema sp. TaxID=166 RepID=UPI0025ED21B1|nr:hypothetical protein [Treponema sp.]MCR5218155.1 hypothetical protein [Treponema sp.]